MYRNFTCTSCGKCCNREPEVELSETLGLADNFVFHLMFRPYELDISVSEYAKNFEARKLTELERHEYFQRRKLLEESAQIKYMAISNTFLKPRKVKTYIYISAIALQIGKNSCSMHENGRCRIYAKRPYSCQTVPFHYSIVEAALQDSFDKFVKSEGYMCDTTCNANKVMERGFLTCDNYLLARNSARETMKRDSIWKVQIAKKMEEAHIGKSNFPNRQQIEANAKFGASSIPMMHGWEAALEIGIINKLEFKELIAKQLQLIKDFLKDPLALNASSDQMGQMKILINMASDYKNKLDYFSEKF